MELPPLIGVWIPVRGGATCCISCEKRKQTNTVVLENFFMCTVHPLQGILCTVHIPSRLIISKTELTEVYVLSEVKYFLHS